MKSEQNINAVKDLGWENEDKNLFCVFFFFILKKKGGGEGSERRREKCVSRS